MISPSEWSWFGSAGHLCVGSECRFHLCTQVGDFLISTVGEWLPSESGQKIIARSRGFEILHRGDAGEAEFLEKNRGYEEIGCGRKYETMAFRVSGVCSCGCGLPSHTGRELVCLGTNTPQEARANHMKVCRDVAHGVLFDEE